MLPLVIALILWFAPGAHADPADRIPATLDHDYAGTHPDLFAQEYDRVRILVHLAQLEVSSRLGLMQYREGFQYPLTVRFQDGAPEGLESTLAFVHLKGSEKGF